MGPMSRRIAITFLLALLAVACGPAPTTSPPPASSVPAARGGVELWQDGSIFDAVKGLLAVDTPGRHVWIEMYEFGRVDLGDALERAAKAGADVRVVLDPSVGASRDMGRKLSAAGVPVRFYPVDERRHQIDHVKLVVTDAAALVGGMNWGRGSANNHDYALRLTDSGEIARLRSIFEQDWSLSGGSPAPLTMSAGAVSQTTPGEEIRHVLLAQIGATKTSVDVEIYTLTDGMVVAALSDAHRRGVRVRVVIDPNQTANQRAVADLDAAGVPVRRYPIPRGALLHAKAGLFDEKVLVLGSANWTHSGLSVNHEVDVTTSDGAATRSFEARFTRDWAASS